MSEVFEGYERQYGEVSASLTRKCTAASTLDGEKKKQKQKLSEIQSGVEEAELLVSTGQRGRLPWSLSSSSTGGGLLLVCS